MTTTAPVVVAGCQGCGACLLTCPQHALQPVPGGLTVLARCDGCGECVEVCPVDAIAFTAIHRTDQSTTDRSPT